MAQTNVLEEILVTAQKREENVQDISIAVSAFSAEIIKELGFTEPTDFIEMVPNVNLQSTLGESGPASISIRGVQIFDNGDANESSTAIYLDEVYQGTVSAVAGQIFDVERAEILRGPQGTLYGRNTTGGVFHFISRKPTEEFEGYLNLQLGSNEQKIVEAAISGPLSETARGRLAIKYNNDDGWQHNQTLGNDLAQTDMFSVRGILDVDFSDTTTSEFIIYYTDSDGLPQNQGFRGTIDPNDPTFSTTCPIARIVNNECGNRAGFVDLDPTADTVFTSATNLTDQLRIFGGSVKFNWDLGWADVTSITGYNEVEKLLREDATAAPEPANLFLLALSGDAEQFTQEIRFSGGTDSVNWVFGGYYYSDEKFVTSFFETLGGFGSFADLETKSLAAFGQVNFDISDTLTGVMGMRYTDEEKDATVTGVNGGVIETRQGDVSFSLTDTSKSQQTTGKIGLEWRPNDHTMTYANISTGFKSPAYNTTTVGDAPSVGPVGAEELTSFEIGMKSNLLDGRARLNVAGFYYDYNGIQVVIGELDPNSGIVVNRFSSLGGADIFGLEAELYLKPSDNFDAILGLGLMNTEINSRPGVTISGFPVDGNRLSGVPEVNVNGLIRYHLPNLFDGHTTVQASFRWQDDVFMSATNEEIRRQDSYGLLNLRGTWSSQGERFHVAAFVDNVTDKDYTVHIFQSLGLDVGHLLFGKPRLFGVEFGINF